MIDGFLVVFILALLVIYVIAMVRRRCVTLERLRRERLGKYSETLDVCFQVLLPFVNCICYKHSLKVTANDISEQVCIMRENVQVSVDGILYLKVEHPQRAS